MSLHINADTGEFYDGEAGIYGTCDWGGCDKPANQLRDGLPVCDDCAVAPCPYCKGTRQIVTRHPVYGDEVRPCENCDR